MMYLEDDEGVVSCTNVKCKSERYVIGKNGRRPAASVNVASISSILSGKLSNPLSRQQFRYRHDRPSNNNMTDIFDGACYKSLVNSQEFFQGKDDVAIGLYIDGFQPFKRGDNKATLVNMVVYNIHPKDR
jgi:hypothetical protein